MEWKYRKEFQVMPGIKLKYGKNGISTQIQKPQNNTDDLKTIQEKLQHQLYKPYEDKHEVKSNSISSLTPESLKEFISLILSANKSFDDTNQIVSHKSASYDAKTNKLDRLNRSLFKFLFKKKRELLTSETSTLKEELEEAQEQLKLTAIHLEVDSEDVYADLFTNVKTAFRLLQKSEKKWDFTSSRATNRIAERTTAGSTITRSSIEISERGLPILEAEEHALCFHNINGGDIYFYPGFLVVYENKTQFALISYTDLVIDFIPLRFIESENLPRDSEVVGETWYKTNKDGSPDKRFASNYKIPIALYGEVKLTSSSGLNELYCFSNHDYAQLFYKALFNYIDSLKKSASLLNAFL